MLPAALSPQMWSVGVLAWPKRLAKAAHALLPGLDADGLRSWTPSFWFGDRMRGPGHAASEDRSHDLRIMKPTRYQPRYHRIGDISQICSDLRSWKHRHAFWLCGLSVCLSVVYSFLAWFGCLFGLYIFLFVCVLLVLFRLFHIVRRCCCCCFWWWWCYPPPLVPGSVSVAVSPCFRCRFWCCLRCFCNCFCRNFPLLFVPLFPLPPLLSPRVASRPARHHDGLPACVCLRHTPTLRREA